MPRSGTINFSISNRELKDKRDVHSDNRYGGRRISNRELKDDPLPVRVCENRAVHSISNRELKVCAGQEGEGRGAGAHLK